MIEWIDLKKSFGKKTVLADIGMTADDGSIFGLVGSNGAGKSTLLRMTAGILKPDAGRILADGEPVYENPAAKANIFYIPDDPCYFISSSPEDMADIYTAFYPGFNRETFRKILKGFRLDPNGRLRSFSRGMVRQSFIALAFASGARIILFDETFDGLDPAARLILKQMIAARVADGTLLPVIASHNLRELEDVADKIAILEDGTLSMCVVSGEESDSIYKIQCAFADEPRREWLDGLNVLKLEIRGRYMSMVIRGSREEIDAALNAHSPLFAETVPMTLEEIFIVRMEEKGYDPESILS